MRKKSRKFILLFIVILALTAVVLYYRQPKEVIAPTQDQSQESAKQSGIDTSNNNSQPTTQNQDLPANSQDSVTQPDKGVFSNGMEAEDLGPDVMVFEVVYDGIKFIPSTLKVKVGDVVIFKNQSIVDFWPISEPKEAYLALDAGGAIEPGKQWVFKAEKIGDWKYFDKLNQVVGGTIKIQK